MDSVIYFALLIVSEDVQGPITSYGLGSLGLRLKLQRDSSSGLVNHHHEKAMLQRAFDDGPGMVASMGYSDIWPVATNREYEDCGKLGGQTWGKVQSQSVQRKLINKSPWVRMSAASGASLIFSIAFENIKQRKQKGGEEKGRENAPLGLD
ncbi:hypothetical protein FOIG_03664 [Fusarium odoratissimum NRRL 54006]|uniref:Uncharacterized protein n=1 Tax=Fusarium odoratissimum (strain NRRL 54006) TaxID=1089451 RepID=X0K0L2_FUSO5|nr:uncharacterized protein FOIG_03664 [Fusarium odoratissimum NRRL 54006]EXM07084.1 hypothetical protein FOIG_03664 [Fusarium odoratissimum NRRL 54006]